MNEAFIGGLLRLMAQQEKFGCKIS